MAQAAVAAGAALAGEAWDRRHEIQSGINEGIELAKLGQSAGKRLANSLLTVRGRKKTAKTIMDKIKNPVRSAKELSSYIASGKALKHISSAAGHANRAISAAEQISGKDLSGAKSIVSNASNEANRYHDTLAAYNTQARDLFSGGT